VTITTEPPADKIIPNEEPAKVVVRATRADGSPAENAKFTVALDMPPKNAFFSTGFPIAEGTPLLRTTAVAPRGELEFKMLFPIRGAYAMNVSAELPGETAAKTDTAFSIGVNEEPAVVRNFTLLICLLAAFGLISGIVLGRSARRASSAVAAALLVMLVQPEMVCAHEEHGQTAPAAPAATVSHVFTETPGGDRISMSLDQEFATVGRLSTLKGAFISKNKPAGPTQFKLSFTNLDHDKEIFSAQLLSPDGVFELQHQFVDGADHRIVLAARPADSPDSAPNQTEMNIAVHAIHPPKVIVFRTLAFLVGIAAAAMAAGYFAALRMRGRSA
jgi:hypothetical protein